MVDLKNNILSNTIMVVKILMLKTSSRMDGIEEDVLDRGAREFDYRQRAKDVPTFHGSINVEDFLNWMSELDTFFKFHEIPMGSRVDLVAYKLKGGAQSWWKNLQLIRECQGKLPITSWERMDRELRRRFLSPNHDQILFNLLQKCVQGNRSIDVYTAEFHRLSSRNDLSETESQQVTRYINGLSPQIHDKISLVPVYTLDDAYNLTIRPENQLATTTKTTNPYARPVMGKCFKCGVQGHRLNDRRANGGKVNLTLMDDEFGNGRETNTSDEDVDAEICHPEGGDYPSTEYSTHSFVIQRILLASKEYDVNATHKGKEDTYTFHHDGVKMVLVPLSDGYSTNVSSSAKCLAKGTGSVEAKVKKK
uniref:Retrotransposon gag domain-containing protein n=1 Tax=Tanacetum cinerariifolium TaxID=118510 RepID=A0A6L2NBY9_TANCI|nr:hypothetical protein CTI12_AA197270 [Tanacetum cinerariifolium]